MALVGRKQKTTPTSHEAFPSRATQNNSHLLAIRNYP